MNALKDGHVQVPVLGEVGEVDEEWLADHEKPGSDDVVDKKAHRRQQVRKAQKEHRKRKEDHIKQLENEVEDMKRAVNEVENQAHLLKIENEALGLALKTAKRGQPHQQQQQQRRKSSQTSPPPPSATHTGGNYTLEPPACVHTLDAIASVHMDEVLNVRTLYFEPGHEVWIQPDGSAYVTQPDGQRMIRGPTPQPQLPLPAPVAAKHQQSQMSSEMFRMHQDEDVAWKAVNFVLALEHPCTTHFLPYGGRPCTGVPTPPSYVPSGHDMMASTDLYRAAPNDVFQVMWSGSPMVGPEAGKEIDHLETKPWTVPMESIQDQVMKYYAMAQNLIKEDWEMTPVQIWFILAETLGIEYLLDPKIYDEFKTKLAMQCRCAGFGSSISQLEFWDIVKDVTGKTFDRE